MTHAAHRHLHRAQSWAIDRESFKRVMMGTTTKKRDKYSDFLGKVDLLSSLTAQERMTIADALAPVRSAATYTPGAAGARLRTVLWLCVSPAMPRLRGCCRWSSRPVRT